MLEIMRKNVGSWIIKFILFGIVIVFAFWGVGGYSGRNANTILRIDKLKVPYSEYQDMYDNMYQALSDSYDRIDSELLASLDLKEQALEALKDRYLLAAEAVDMGIGVTDEEIASRIAATAALQVNGTFSSQLYRNFLDVNQMTSDKFEDLVATDLTIGKITGIIQNSAVITPQEVEEDLGLITNRAAVKILVLSPNLFIGQVDDPDEDELADYYDENAEAFRRPEKFRQDVVVIDPLDYVDKVAVTGTDVEEYYEDNEHRYTVSAAYHLQHILFAFPDAATADSINGIRQLAEDTVERIQQGELTFAAAAARYSHDKATAQKSGDMGMVEEDDIENPILKAVESLEDGEVSQPIPTSRGFQVLKLVEARPERLRDLSEVRGGIEDAIRLDLAREKAMDIVDDILDATPDKPGALKETAQARELKVFDTDTFTRSDLASGDASFPRELLQFALTSEEGELTDAVEDAGKYYVGQTSQRDDSRIPALEEVRGDAEASWKVAEALDLAYEKGQEIVTALGEGKKLSVLSRKVGAGKILTPEPFTILDVEVEGTSGGQQLINDAFTLAEPGDAVLSRGERVHYVVVLDELVRAGEEELAAARPQVSASLIEQRRKEVMDGYLTSLREKYRERIWVNQDLI